MTDEQALRLWRWLRRNKRAPLTSYQARIVFDYVNQMLPANPAESLREIDRLLSDGAYDPVAARKAARAALAAIEGISEEAR